MQYVVLVRGSVAVTVVALGVSGCYASHGTGDGRAERCVAAEPTAEGECEPTFTNRVLPDGVCRLEDGTLLAFADRPHGVSCRGGEDVDRYSFYADLCVEDDRPRRRELAVCDATADDAALGVVEFLSGGRPPFVASPYDGLGSRCAIDDRFIPPNAEPWRPFVEADTLCDDPYAWCGSPLVLELRQLDGDPCAGATYTQRCAATVVDGRIVLRAETAEAEATGCLPAIADRLARCVVPPLPAGRYDVMDEGGRPLGAVEVPGEAPMGDDLTPTCAPVP